jgi:hypothetical protein
MSVMRKYRNPKIWFTTFVLLIFSAGCADYDKPGSNPTVTAPTVTSVAPLNAATGVCPSTVITAIFSVAMNPATINGLTFTLTGPGATQVVGVVTYDASSNTATLTPSSPLALSSVYTATITTGALDVYGIALAANYVWSFTTGANPCAPPTVISETPVAGAVGVCPNFYFDGAGHHIGDRSSHRHSVDRDLHAIQRSRFEHCLHGHHYDRRPGCIWQCASQ